MESVSTLSQTASVNVERIRTLMESNNNRSLYSLQKAIEYYQSCMDIQAIELQSVSKLQEVLLSLGKCTVAEFLHILLPSYSGIGCNGICYRISEFLVFTEAVNYA